MEYISSVPELDGVDVVVLAPLEGLHHERVTTCLHVLTVHGGGDLIAEDQ